jgi:uncharacterized protein
VNIPLPAKEISTETVSEKLARCAEILREARPVLIAYSGGVDSAFLLAFAHEVLGEDARGVIADSPSLPRSSLQAALELARGLKIPVDVITTAELENPGYAANPINRCYYCKAELFTRMDERAKHSGYRAIAYGENADDAGQFRPGVQAAAEFRVLAPLKAAGLTKQEIRMLSRERGLPTADAPAQPCLSSRIPHGTPVTTDALAMIEAAEQVMREFGHRIFRVRHIVGGNGLLTPRDPIPDLAAKIQVAPPEAGKLEARFAEIESRLKGLGYEFVEVDPAGYRGPS